jgi:polyphosphate:AMP phosphotransferase
MARKNGKKRGSMLAVKPLRAVGKEEFERRGEVVRTGLLAAQFEARDAGVAAIVLLAGADREGILEVTNRLTEWMDARLLDVVMRSGTSDEERERPYFFRWWDRMPGRGRIAIVPFGWAHDLLLARLDPKYGRRERVPDGEAMRDFERHCIDSGVALIKIWLHVDDATLAARRKRDPADRPWDPDRVAAKSQRKLERDDRDEEAVLAATNHDSVWRVVSGGDDEARDLEVGAIVRDALVAACESRSAATPPSDEASSETTKTKSKKAKITDRFAALRPIAGDDASFRTRLDAAQRRVNDLARRACRHGIATIVVFEGPDAAGKGGAIRRLTRGIRAPVYDVVPISAPSEEELARPWLWRFWRRVPRQGRMTIFDRSWYGRVLVERVEGFASETEWRRGYREIVDFEAQLRDAGIVLVKFWIEVTEQEQLRRFDARRRVPFKKYKLTPEDYRNRAKRDAYAAAANEAFARTSTRQAPWHVIPGDVKPAARALVVEIVGDALATALDARD